MADLISEDMKAQLMKVIGMKDSAEFDKLLKEHAPDIKPNMSKTSPFDVQFVLFRNYLEEMGIENLTKLETTEEKIEYIYSVLWKDPQFKNIKSLLPEKKGNQTGDSKKLREDGNLEFQKKNFEDAIRLYNQSASVGTLKEIALSLANRSVVFFNLKEFENCLSDCEAALLFGYPKELKHKIDERRGRCYKALGKYTNAKTSFEEALAGLEKSSLKKEKREEVCKELASIIRELPMEDKTIQELVPFKHFTLNIEKKHSQFPSLSASVEIHYSERMGRYAVAKKDIRPGELILVEDPISWSLNPESMGSVCMSCNMMVGRQMVPSRRADSAAFCSLACFKKTDGENPLSETQDNVRLVNLFNVGKELGASVMLTYWAVRREPVEFFVSKEKELFTERDLKYGSKNSADLKLCEKDSQFKMLFNLVNHMEQQSEETRLSVLIKSTVILRFLHVFGYFDSLKKDDFSRLTAAEKLIGRLLYHFQFGIKYNQHGVYQTSGQVLAGKNLPLVDIGTAIYPTLLLLNHSCSPNTFRINKGKKTYLVAKCRIRGGEEITDCYGIHYLSIPREERLATLQKGFQFTCNCQACSDRWPGFPELESGLSQSAMGKLGTLLSSYQKRFREGKFAEGLDCCSEYLEKMDSLNIPQPHRNYEIAGLALSSCYWANMQAAMLS